ncbi:MAG: SDR family oxidoreductase [Deltaproteobacteria bacterium]|nr:SDR family oxidoreductase [Deltaproteobacteria bacterium]
MTKLLEGKVAIITGATRPKGMGWATALKMAAQGASVVVTGKCRVRPEIELTDFGMPLSDGFSALEALVREIEDLGSRGLAVAVDVTVQDEVTACVEKTCETFGGVDILFNNAGTGVGAGPFLDIPNEQWDLSWQVNVMGMVNFIRAVIPSMRVRGGGSIINNSSVSGQVAYAGLPAYMTTKHAVVGLTKVVAAEFGPEDIRCNVICPGVILTDMGEAEIRFLAKEHGISEEAAEKMLTGNCVMARAGMPSEVGDLVAYLAGPAASYLTGTQLPVSGGWTYGIY